MRLAIVEIVKVSANARTLEVRELSPNPNDGPLPAIMMQYGSLTQDASGIYSVPETAVGVKAYAIKNDYLYVIVGFVPDYSPQFGERGTIHKDETLEPGDINMRSSAGNRVSVFKDGTVALFANVFSWLNLDQKTSSISGWFKKMNFFWYGGSIKANGIKFRMLLTNGYEDPSKTDENLATGENISPELDTDAVLDSFTYVDKAIIHNEESPLHVETRQRTAPPDGLNNHKSDTYTVEDRGKVGDGPIYRFYTLDKSSYTDVYTTDELIDEDGITRTSLKEEQAAVPGPGSGAVDYLATSKLGPETGFSLETDDVATSITFKDEEERVVLTSNDDSLIIGESFTLKRESEAGAYSLTVDKDGLFKLTTPQFEIRSDAEAQLFLQVANGGKVYLGGTVGAGDDVDVSDQAQGTDNVLTPNTMPEVFDTFTGIPLKGSPSVGAKK